MMRIVSFVALTVGLLAGGALSACSSMNMGPIFADPGQYEFHNCEQLAERRKFFADRELELKQLIDRAEQGTGGALVVVIAYQSDYVRAREEIKLIDATARVKKCAAPDNLPNSTAIK
jgi:hypothetical protein